MPTTRVEMQGTGRMVNDDYMTGDDLMRQSMDASTASAFGPEAVERAQTMAYERTIRIQQESPYVSEEVVEHVVHDHRLYVGMWITAGVAAVSAFLTFSLACLIITGVALLFALSATPGRQARN